MMLVGTYSSWFGQHHDAMVVGRMAAAADGAWLREESKKKNNNAKPEKSCLESEPRVSERRKKLALLSTFHTFYKDLNSEGLVFLPRNAAAQGFCHDQPLATDLFCGG